jgi:hypothetical protein
MTTHNYLLFYEIIILFITFLTVTRLLFKNSGKNNIVAPIDNSLSVVLCLFVILTIAFYPIELGSDKQRYYILFINAFKTFFVKDIGWYYYTVLCKSIFNNSTIFFTITSVVYFIGNYYFLKAIVPKKYLFYFLLTLFGSLGYFGYGTNTMRAGVALSLFLIAFVKRKNVVPFVIFVCLSVLIHKSMLILVLSLILTKYIKNHKFYILFWLSFLIISILNLTFITSFIQDSFLSVDDRVGEYLSSKSNELYKAGYRYDFLLYSLFPIITGYYYIYKLKFRDILYQQLYNIYLLVNSFWLLLIRIPFNDRFAYLSWFLFPLLLSYPLFIMKHQKKKNIKIAYIMLLIILLNFILIIK